MATRARIAWFGALAAALFSQCAPRERPVAPDPVAPQAPVDAGTPPPPRDTRVGSTALACLRPGLDEDLHRCGRLPNPPLSYGEVWSKLDVLERIKGPPAQPGSSAPRPLTREETAFLDAARDYLCAEKSPPPNIRDLAFDRGRVYRDANHFAEAAVFFRDALLRGGDDTPYAAQLLLDCLNVLSRETPSCVATMRDVMPVVLARVCGKGGEGAETCDRLRRLDADLGKSP